jgi:hypothetical protein
MSGPSGSVTEGDGVATNAACSLGSPSSSQRLRRKKHTARSIEQEDNGKPDRWNTYYEDDGKPREGPRQNSPYPRDPDSTAALPACTSTVAAAAATALGIQELSHSKKGLAHLAILLRRVGSASQLRGFGGVRAIDGSVRMTKPRSQGGGRGATVWRGRRTRRRGVGRSRECRRD